MAEWHRDELQVNIQPPSAGWLRICLSGRAQRIALCASYTPRDTFADLVAAVTDLYERGTDQTVQVNEEPEIVTLRLLKRGDNLILESRVAGARAVTRLQADFDQGCRELARRLKSALEDFGYERFTQEWRHRPPRKEVRQLWSHFAPGRGRHERGT